MELLNKLSKYNIVNYFVPGVVFCVMAKEIFEVDIAGNNLVLGTFVYYFIGMCVSRVGSVILEPTLKWLGFIKFSDYSDYLNAEGQDNKIPELLETANFYRSILGGAFTFVVLGLGMRLIEKEIISESTLIWTAVSAVLALTLFGYRKQVDYIRKRVEKRTSRSADS